MPLTSFRFLDLDWYIDNMPEHCLEVALVLFVGADLFILDLVKTVHSVSFQQPNPKLDQGVYLKHQHFILSVKHA